MVEDKNEGLVSLPCVFISVLYFFPPSFYRHGLQANLDHLETTMEERATSHSNTIEPFSSQGVESPCLGLCFQY
jgi:hypothetical protein